MLKTCLDVSCVSFGTVYYKPLHNAPLISRVTRHYMNLHEYYINKNMLLQSFKNWHSFVLFNPHCGRFYIQSNSCGSYYKSVKTDPRPTLGLLQQHKDEPVKSFLCGILAFVGHCRDCGAWPFVALSSFLLLLFTS